MLTRRSAWGLPLAFAAAPKARAQAIDRTARLIIGFPPGGSSDVVARLYAEHMRGLYAPTVIVEARSGAGGRLALEAGKAAVPDGTTLIQSPAGQLTIYPHIYRRLNYSLDDFTPVAPLVSYQQVLVVKADHPAQNLAQFGEWAKRTGREPTYGTPGAGTWAHFQTVQIAKYLGIGMSHVPYRGTAPGLQDLLAGQVDSVSCVLGEATELYRAGQLRILGVSSAERVPRVPDVATYAEQGYPALTSEEWFALFLPARTPANIVEAAHRAITAAQQKPELRATLDRLEYRIPVTTPAEFAAQVRRERDAWAPVVAESGYRAEE
ncbi:tripartite tricarboxylate transporter substrate-binding protein [Muricoccus radiodurans]|uniref:tripartite tricarboxylate transporter substrate-binding protein n=1 Tax=Muricoccus radiodurans TaxID=2231721 RepID=UPI003CE84C30